jgi:hypothetical protein
MTPHTAMAAATKEASSQQILTVLFTVLLIGLLVISVSDQDLHLIFSGIWTNSIYRESASVSASFIGGRPRGAIRDMFS